MDDLLLKTALRIRRAEEKLLELFSEGKLNGTTHTCIGQEWSAVAVAHALQAGDRMFSTHRGHGHFLARTGDLTGFFAELMGRHTGVCAGRGGSQHLHAEGFCSNGIQGSLVPISAGCALAAQWSGSAAICVVFVGDGTLGEGIVYETLNLIAKWRIPLLVVVEDNRYAQSTRKDQTMAGTLEGRAEAFGIEYRQAATWDPDALIAQAAEAVTRVRNNRTPLVLEIETYRLQAHSKGRDFRDPAEVTEFQARDPLNRVLASREEELRQMLREIDAEIDTAVAAAEQAPEATLDPEGRIHAAPKCRRLEWLAHDDDEGRVSDLLYDTFRQALEARPNLVMLGEDLEAPYGGAFNVTRDLSALFPGRVRNTPISEAAITGLGTGLALGGCLPVVEIMFGDFVSLVFDQLLQCACKFRFMYNEQVRVPLIVRTPMGGRRGYGPTHSQSLEKYFLGIPGLTVLALNARLSPARVYETLFETIESPTLVVENKVLYTRRLHTAPLAGFRVLVSNEPYPTVRIAPSEEKPDATLVCYGGMLEEAELALQHAFYEHEIVCEIICPTRLHPLDISAIADSVARTRRLVTVEEGSAVCALSSEILAQLAELSIQPIRTLRLAYDSTLPCSAALENRLLPNADSIARALREVCHD